ncbi:hypothetical protein EV204_105242 [Tissierella praeacuta]|uniref:hypothetical protein n=1 Tax=Tissierella praeacuta TaxID=43131 RepID=UPI00104F21CD|nr:hypothetical protein [Tissierella praeacuta]TCU72906.1 hypothetical protein EV204_105242 [Tissierella praeacuta]
MKEYALYKGEEILAMGTVSEIAKEMNIKKETVLYYRTPTQKKRSKSDNCRILIPLNEEEED